MPGINKLIKGMMTLSNEIRVNILKVTAGIFILSALAVTILAFTPYFDYTAITGALLGWVGASLNFTFLAFVVSKAVEKDEKNARSYVQATYTARLLFMAVVIVIGIKLPYFNGYVTILPFIFVRPVITLINLIFKKKDTDK